MSNLLEAAKEALRATIDIKYGIEQSRIWNGTGWTYNPLSPVIYKPLIDRAEIQIEALRQAIEKERRKDLDKLAEEMKVSTVAKLIRQKHSAKTLSNRKNT